MLTYGKIITSKFEKGKKTFTRINFGNFNNFFSLLNFFVYLTIYFS